MASHNQCFKHFLLKNGTLTQVKEHYPWLKIANRTPTLCNQLKQESPITHTSAAPPRPHDVLLLPQKCHLGKKSRSQMHISHLPTRCPAETSTVYHWYPVIEDFSSPIKFAFAHMQNRISRVVDDRKMGEKP